MHFSDGNNAAKQVGGCIRVGLLTTDIISLLFAFVIMFILRGVDGMIEDQKAYLFRLERQRKEEAKAQYYSYDEE